MLYSRLSVRKATLRRHEMNGHFAVREKTRKVFENKAKNRSTASLK